MLKHRIIGVLLVASWAIFVSTARAQTGTLAQADVAVKLFNKYCLMPAPTFASISKLATDSGLVVSQRNRDGFESNQMQWLILVHGEGPPMRLDAMEGPSPNGSAHVTECGVEIPGVSGLALRHALSTDSGLGKPSDITTGPNGGVLVDWSVQLAGIQTNAGVMLKYDMPKFSNDIFLSYQTY